MAPGKTEGAFALIGSIYICKCLLQLAETTAKPSRVVTGCMCMSIYIDSRSQVYSVRLCINQSTGYTKDTYIHLGKVMQFGSHLYPYLLLLFSFLVSFCSSFPFTWHSLV
ncbi:hypothetical protein H112_02054 [Trichophyton rubrum D6]|uniref:Uncharacterized protein n=3 Tax=Trichophyton TaxID=5550 RepID=A0A080WL98_TRIRC|nr:uncharacterized protein TERG_12455 [Trichophyton rubrum CBS 118892]EZF25746.1 hypothetical protein H100_02052 [Trichophyton rubrum MR850]EZF44757.1 hypothetical protein H102_02047 [Trichophyton rubrum CBS 100081]EZF55353.1 hypothetical protein H103_02057 [Trichophyton rubrum CBS 288.86]EZF65967.1 hypothetical protein H104_02034 [Trichophyton rubrum CBS 289.86]EZF76601.1 hypothetical protein H105_02066 [Trichophyton soudanense CBS 452.61]EZF98069.1 hypothetical protein H113_02058 [Trichophy